jgi:hypothetical protein
LLSDDKLSLASTRVFPVAQQWLATKDTNTIAKKEICITTNVAFHHNAIFSKLESGS